MKKPELKMNFVAVSVVALTIYSIAVRAQVPTSPQTAPPPQEKCPEIPALPFVPNLQASVTKWWVGNITVMQQPFENLNSKDNFCSAVSYINADDCKGIAFAVNFDPNTKVQILDTYASNVKTETVVHYNEVYQQIDPNYYVFQGSIKSMEYISSKGHHETTPVPVEQIPQPVNDIHEKPFVIIGSNDKNEWNMFQICEPNTETVWIAYAAEVVKPGNLMQFDDAIIAELNKRHIKAQLVPVETTLPIPGKP